MSYRFLKYFRVIFVAISGTAISIFLILSKCADSGKYTIAKWTSGRDQISLASEYGSSNGRCKEIEFKGKCVNKIDIYGVINRGKLVETTNGDTMMICHELPQVVEDVIVYVDNGIANRIVFHPSQRELSGDEYKIWYDGIEINLKSSMNDVIDQLAPRPFIISYHHK